MNFKKILKFIKSLRFILYLRNFFKIRAVAFLPPKTKDGFVSDFFFFDCKNKKNTKFIVTNFSSQVFFDKKIKEKIELVVYDLKGNKILNKKYNIKKHETLEIDFAKLKLKNSQGSFFIFHYLSDYEELISQRAYGAERGYAAYKGRNGIWNFMHANGLACHKTKKGKINSLVSTSFFKNKYIPQLSFEDVSEFSLILNNPTLKNVCIEVKIFNKDWKLIENKMEKLKKFQTHIFSFYSNDAVFAEVSSNIIFCRPIIRKIYQSGFDMLHG